MRSLEKSATITRLEVRPLVWSLVIMLYLSALIPQTGMALTLLGFVSFQALKDFYTMMPLLHELQPNGAHHIDILVRINGQDRRYEIGRAS